MPTIKIDEFQGIAPKIHPTLLGANMAQKAHNCVLKSGKLVPLRQPSVWNGLKTRLEGGLETLSNAKTIYLWHRNDGKDELLAWSGVVSVAKSNITDDPRSRLFISGDTDYPNVGDKQPYVLLAEDSAVGIDRIAMVKDMLPAPVASVITPAEQHEGDQNICYTSFFQTWVDETGYESPCSMPSAGYEEGIPYWDGDSFEIGAVSSADTPAQAVARRIYKVVAVNDPSGLIRYVTEQKVNAAGGFNPITFRLLDADLGESLHNMESPPEDLRQVRNMAGNYLVGFSPTNPQEVRFSDIGLPCSWPMAFGRATKENIVGLATTLNTVFVLTKGTPYQITGTAPENMVCSELAGAQGCVSERSICTMNGAVYYISEDGICMLAYSGDALTAPKVITEPFFSRREWQALGPHDALMVAHDGALFVWFPTVYHGYRFEFPENASAITTHDERATAAYSDPDTDRLIFVKELVG